MVHNIDREITSQLLLRTKQMQLREINLLLVNVYLFIYWLSQQETKRPTLKTEGKHLSTPFLRLNLTPSLQIPVSCPCYYHKLHTAPSVWQQMWKGLQSVHSSSSLQLFFLTLVLYSRVDSPQAIFFWNIHLFQHEVFYRLQQIICCIRELLSPWYCL